ncbi:hypothetical protein VIGAN_10119000, partial [Vigna angularis var. angularis]
LNLHFNYVKQKVLSFYLSYPSTCTHSLFFLNPNTVPPTHKVFFLSITPYIRHPLCILQSTFNLQAIRATNTVHIPLVHF